MKFNGTVEQIAGFISDNKANTYSQNKEISLDFSNTVETISWNRSHIWNLNFFWIERMLI